ncbi:MAG: hypothetical protein KDH89_19090 [Anaerolineae bacterium]|nr:hypothetical protein [Anaerolineae bacterium]
MKTALDHNGSPVEAGAGQPEQARCPSCGGVVVLRRRRRGRPQQGVTYFWRHQDHENNRCPARFEASSNGKKKKA